MHTLESLLDDLSNMGISPEATLLVHTSMKAIGEVDGGADTVLDALVQYMSPGLLVFPTHTWNQINAENPVYDPATTPSCVGLLTNLFLNRAGVVRSWHPTHSVAALGKDAASFCSGEEKLDTPCHRLGCHGKLYDRAATILFLGCSLQSNTLLHGVEEWNSIPSRLTDHHEALFIRQPDGSLLARPMRRHSTEFGDVSRNYDKVEPLFLENRIVTMRSFGDAECRVCDARAMVDGVTDLLKQQPMLFNDSAPL